MSQVHPMHRCIHVALMRILHHTRTHAPWCMEDFYVDFNYFKHLCIEYTNVIAIQLSISAVLKVLLRLCVCAGAQIGAGEEECPKGAAVATWGARRMGTYLGV